MAELRHRLRFPQQTGARSHPLLRSIRVGAQQLQRHLAIELRIVGGVDDPHPADTDPVDDHVPIHDRPAVEPTRGLGEPVLIRRVETRLGQRARRRARVG